MERPSVAVFFKSGSRCALEPRVFHVLPKGEEAWDYGQTLFAGSDMSERREILARLSQLFLVIEGGPGTRHEVEVASSKKAVIIPAGRSGGQAAELYARSFRPPMIDQSVWSLLGAKKATPEETASAMVQAVQMCL